MKLSFDVGGLDLIDQAVAASDNEALAGRALGLGKSGRKDRLLAFGTPGIESDRRLFSESIIRGQSS